MLSDYHSCIRAGAYIALRTPSGILKVQEIKANCSITIQKFGSFNSNLLIGLPYFLTFEIVDQEKLQFISANELYAEMQYANTVEEVSETPDGPNTATTTTTAEAGGALTLRNNRLTIDNASRQTLSHEDIELLKKQMSGKETVAKIMESHSGLEEKTAYSLAKYALRKHQKYVPRFTVLPLDIRLLLEYIVEKDPVKVMELREETVSLITSWANVHHAGTKQFGELPVVGGGRRLVVDDTSGLMIAAVAEKMGMLYPRHHNQTNGNANSPTNPRPAADTLHPHPHTNDLHQMGTSNTITLIHPSAQANTSLLRYFGYTSEDPDPTHPLFSHLLTLSWLQLLDPTADAAYNEEPEKPTDEELASWKSPRRGAYHRKRRRWARIQRTVHNTQAGDFDGLVVASWMEPAGVLKHLVPLVRGGGQVVVYSPSVESLTNLMDLYSRDRKAAFIQQMRKDGIVNTEDFPLDPTLLLNPMLQTARAIEWQVLPNRTHPLMTMKGSNEGYIFSATRVLPAGAEVNGKGRHSNNKKRKAETDGIKDEHNAAKKSKSVEPEIDDETMVVDL